MRRHASLARGVVVLGIVAVISPTAQQQPSAPPPPRENTPGGLAGAVPPTTTPVPYSDALAGERSFAVGVLPPFSWGPIEPPKPHVPDGFTPILNGTNLVGWHPSHANLHGTAPDFFVLDGAIVATQDPLGQGGILLTDKRYKNFELYMEVKPDYGATAASSYAPRRRDMRTGDDGLLAWRQHGRPDPRRYREPKPWARRRGWRACRRTGTRRHAGRRRHPARRACGQRRGGVDSRNPSAEYLI